MQARPTRLPWLFFIGPDGVVHSTRSADQEVTLRAAAIQGLGHIIVA